MAVLAERAETGNRTGWRAGLLDAAPLAIAGVVANGGSLLVTLVLAHLLAVHDYGALNQLIGVFFVVSTPGSAVLVGVVRRVSRWTASLDEVRHWGAAVHRHAILALGLFTGAVLAAGPWVASLLGRRDALGLDSVAIAGAVWVLLCVDRGLLQGRREYRALSTNLLFEGGARTVFMIAFGAAGFGVSGVAMGVLVAELCTAVHARILADRAWGRGAAGGTPPRRTARPAPVALLQGKSGSRRRPWPASFGRDRVARRDLVVAVVGLVAIAVLQNVDVIVIGREAPHAAGGYAAVSVACKALVFVALAVAGYLLPEAAIAWRDGRHALRQLLVSLVVLALPAAILLAVAAGLARPFLQTVFSGRYTSASGAFLPLALAMVCLSVTVIVTMYLLGVGDRWFVVALVSAAALATTVVVLAGGAPRATAFGDMGVQAFLLCAAVGELARIHRAATAATPIQSR